MQQNAGTCRRLALFVVAYVKYIQYLRSTHIMNSNRITGAAIKADGGRIPRLMCGMRPRSIRFIDNKINLLLDNYKFYQSDSADPSELFFTFWISIT